MYKTRRGFLTATPDEKMNVIVKLQGVKKYFCCQCTYCWACGCWENKALVADKFVELRKGHWKPTKIIRNYCVECGAVLQHKDGRLYGGKHSIHCSIKSESDLLSFVEPALWLLPVKKFAEQHRIDLPSWMRKFTN